MDRALKDGMLDEVAERGMRMVIDRFNFRSSVELWKGIIEGTGRAK